MKTCYYTILTLVAVVALASCKKDKGDDNGPVPSNPSLPAANAALLADMTGKGVPVAGSDVAGTYVGAFWKSAQTGERVIKINVGLESANTGAWSAEVAYYDGKWDPSNGDGVVLSTTVSADANIYQDSPGDAENYKVSGTVAKVSGTVALNRDIVFRIGLTKTFAAYNASTAPARYAVVVLTYGTPAKKQKLFLRQGEGADYVMRPGDTDGLGNAVDVNRPKAIKFSPYNLTDPNMGVGGPALASHNQLAVASGVFVDYPTKAGAFFQWASTAQPRRAYHPVSPTGVITGWLSSDYGPELWNATTDETCPAGYRRPRDSNTATGPVAGSEMRQSLWLNPQSGYDSNIDNSFFGYYADGYFDRRAITDALIVTKSAVSPSTKDVAYIGRLFFNPHVNASLFFPAVGDRLFNGALSSAGLYGFYWSSSPPSMYSAWYLHFSFGGYARQFSGDHTSGFTVRCVLQ